MLCCGGDNSDCPPRHICRGQAYVQLPDADAAVPAGVQVCVPVGDCDVFGSDCGSGEACLVGGCAAWILTQGDPHALWKKVSAAGAFIFPKA
jgi:hypothetical protein